MSRSKQSEEKPSFESALAALERIVDDMEGGQLSLEDSLAAYKRGIELIKGCQQQLADAEVQLRVLDSDNLKPLDLPAERS
jgi:exodeoxyribonuclease VII small subunit